MSKEAPKSFAERMANEAAKLDQSVNAAREKASAQSQALSKERQKMSELISVAKHIGPLALRTIDTDTVLKKLEIRPKKLFRPAAYTFQNLASGWNVITKTRTASDYSGGSGSVSTLYNRSGLLLKEDGSLISYQGGSWSKRVEGEITVDSHKFITNPTESLNVSNHISYHDIEVDAALDGLAKFAFENSIPVDNIPADQ